MLPVIESLLVIQDRDHLIKSLKAELDKIPQDAANIKRKLDTAASELTAAKEAVVQNELAMKQINLDRQVRKDTMEKINVQRFETKKNDEYAALGAELTRYQDMIDELETQELEYMEKIDTLQETLNAAKEKLELTKASMAADVKALTEKKAQNTNRIQEVTADRTKLAANIDADILAAYDRIFAKKGNAAVSPMSDNQCGGCHMKVISDVASRTIDEKEISHCNNCGCFLYSV